MNTYYSLKLNNDDIDNEFGGDDECEPTYTHSPIHSLQPAGRNWKQTIQHSPFPPERIELAQDVRMCDL